MAKNTVFQQKKTINAGGQLIDLSEPLVMGILNTTPDSFFEGSRAQTIEAALRRTEEMLSQGAGIIDIGAYSSRPGATVIAAEEETARLLPVIKAIGQRFPEAILSVDTFRAKVAEAAITEGAHIINDISGGELDEELFDTLGKLKVPYILMHMRGTPQTMNSLTEYDDLFGDIMQYFAERLARLKQLGIHDVILDPGFGFAKTADQNFELLNKLDLFKIAGLPVLAGLSRKKMIWKTLNTGNQEALNGTTVLNTIALMKGASILRVHDVKEAAEAIKLVGRLK